MFVIQAYNFYLSQQQRLRDWKLFACINCIDQVTRADLIVKKNNNELDLRVRQNGYTRFSRAIDVRAMIQKRTNFLSRRIQGTPRQHQILGQLHLPTQSRFHVLAAQGMKATTLRVHGKRQIQDENFSKQKMNRNSSKQLVWIQNCVKLLTYVWK